MRPDLVVLVRCMVCQNAQAERNREMVALVVWEGSDSERIKNLRRKCCPKERHDCASPYPPPLQFHALRARN